METLGHIRHLFNYNDWANRRLIVAVKESTNSRTLEILGHLLTTELEYYERLFGKDSTGFNFWPTLSIESCGDLARQTAEKYEKLLRRFDEDGLNISASYKTSEGSVCENSYREILSHVLLHSATHRGNVITRLRDEGIAPPQIDYIIYLRETKYI